MTDSTLESPKSWESPDKRFIKTVLSKGYGLSSPQDGSVCKLKIIIDEDNILSDVDADQVKELIVGDVDDPVDRLLEACVKTMKLEEICHLKFKDPLHVLPFDKQNSGAFMSHAEYLVNKKEFTEIENNKVNATENSEPMETNAFQENKNPDEVMTSDAQTDSEQNEQLIESENQKDPISENADPENVNSSDPIEDSNELLNSTMPKIYEVKLQLLIYTREPEIYEMSITEKWRRANYHKQKGMELYARGSYEWAFRRFGLALKYIISLEHDIPSGHEEGMNITGLKLSCFLNAAACQMRHHNYEFVVQNCTKALKIEPNNSKALYRRGAAYVQLQEYEKAKTDLDTAQEMEPKNLAIVKQQQLLKSRVQKLNQYYANAMKKMFT